MLPEVSLSSDQIVPMELDEALASIPLGFFHYRLLLICGLSFIADGMEISLIFFISTCAGEDWGLSDNEIALIASVVFCGLLIGTFCWGPLADAYGRRTVFIAGSVLISVAGFLSGCSPNYLSLLVLRAAVGFGLGSSSVPFDLLAEFCPASYRGSFLIYIEYFWTLGSVLVAGSAWALLGDYSWRMLTYITAIPVSLSCLGSIPVLPESPRWLLTQGRVQDAEAVIRKASEINSTPLPVFKLKPIHTVIANKYDEKYSSEGSAVHAITALCTLSNLKLALPMWTVWLCFGASYYGTILFNGLVMENNNDDSVSCSFNYSSIFVSAASEVVGCSIVVLIIDRWGRVGSQFFLYVTGAIGALLMGFTTNSQSLFTVWSICARLGVFAASAGTWVHTPELFRTEMRATGHAVSNASAQIGSAVVPFMVYRLRARGIGVFLAALNVISAVCVVLLPETSRNNLDEETERLSLGDIMERVGSKSFSNRFISEHDLSLEDALMRPGEKCSSDVQK
mmetsp:Transcript_15946/g.24027  ORF Transcript_15946/g.24027 Transcript_15946/m.24027 type:complete len:510 (+) Transcript_15946:121-1650(+)|eukprot:CAMPEP_0185034140 /NCGR_PEP_ID=MMETSP1103-20130426/23746_1 /TAXON_ID=36769 /ORGANISM="Paraphysomonas bandaiensis, Strain Caron Lab Isolate" /LENGTH=509 /DNA_ID=CAMNT_0027570675 /DNA_START=56 /DNA_END=1585 /DNA_ORIENTATION=+